MPQPLLKLAWMGGPLYAEVRRIIRFVFYSYALFQRLAIPPWSALAADGGGLDTGGRHEKQVMIRPMLSRSACTTCPVGLTGNLVAIEGILKAESAHRHQ